MKDRELVELLSRGQVSRVDLDPKLRPDINRQSLENAVREIRKLIAAKKSVSIIIVKN
jgi:hypothetical protein